MIATGIDVPVPGRQQVDPDARPPRRRRHRAAGRTRGRPLVLRPSVGAGTGPFEPLEDQMVDTIREIVTHVYLGEDVYEKEEKGFLGITMPRPGDEDRMQVMVETRMAGFGGYAGLRDGDVILDLVGQPLPQPLDRDVFIDAIKAMRPESVVKLKVLRQGAVRVVAVRVSAPRVAASRDAGPILRKGFATPIPPEK